MSLAGVKAKKPALEQPIQAVGKESFAWLKNWYPLANVADLATAEPSAHILLNIKMVVWQDASGTWSAAEDKCPHRSGLAHSVAPARHMVGLTANCCNADRTCIGRGQQHMLYAFCVWRRLAPLSEGRIQDGNLACNYHGWQFDRQGACLLNPQVVALFCALHATVTASVCRTVNYTSCCAHINCEVTVMFIVSKQAYLHVLLTLQEQLPVSSCVAGSCLLLYERDASSTHGTYSMPTSAFACVSPVLVLNASMHSPSAKRSVVVLSLLVLPNTRQAAYTAK